MLGFLSKTGREINKVILLPVSRIDSNPNQPRRYFDTENLTELAESIRANGLLQPITVRQSMRDGCYELIAGERRTIAFRMLGYDMIPAIVEEYNDQQSAVLSLIENLQRKDLNYFEEASGISRLMCELSLTQQQVSEKIGKAQPTVANKLRLLKYSPAVQNAFLDHGLTERHARSMLKLQSEEEQMRVIALVAENKLNVDQTEQYVDRLVHKKPADQEKTRIYVVKDMRIFLNTINRAISIMQHAGIPVDTDKNENDQYMEYLIRVPKSAIYRRPAQKESVPS